MVETELGEWRRTHYSKELDASMAGSDVTIMGWISSIRGHGNITFLTIVDKMGEIQVVTKKGENPDDLVSKRIQTEGAFFYWANWNSENI